MRVRIRLCVWVVTAAAVQFSYGLMTAGAADDPNRVVITITDKQGNPLADVQVTESETGEKYVTDTKGQCVCQTLNRTQFFYAGDNRRVLAATGSLGAGGTELRMQLAPARLIRGGVSDQSGKPLAGATILILPGSWSREETLSDATGRFALVWDPNSRGPSETTFYLVGRHVPRDLAAADQIDKDARAVDIKLAPGVALTGRVTDPAGKGIAGASVTPRLETSSWGSSVTRSPVLTESDGTFHIATLPAKQRYEISAFAGGYGTNRATIDEDLSSNGRVDIGLLKLAPAGLSVSGQVVDPAGNPVPDALLEAHAGNRSSGIRVKAASDGHFVFRNLGAGLLNVSASATRDGRLLAADVVTDAGASDIEIVLHEGESATQYLGIRTYDQTLAAADKVIAGTVVDMSGKPVAGVPVGVCWRTEIREDGTRRSQVAPPFDILKGITDAQGRFAIALQEDGEYNLLFSPDRYAATIVYNIPFNTRDLKVTLENGGTLDGRLLRLEKGQKVPIPNAPVKLKQADLSAYTHLGRECDRTTITDAQGRFHFDHIATKTRPAGTMSKNQWTPVPRAWNLVSGDTEAPVLFTDGDRIEDFELIVKPDPDKAPSLVGRPLPPLDDLKTSLSADQTKDKAVLICFFDFQQRPARNAVLQLTKQADQLKTKGIVVITVEVSNAAKDTLDAWVKQNNVSVPIGATGRDAEETRFAWGVKALPWLILTDKDHIVRAEGFAVGDLDKVLQEAK